MLRKRQDRPRRKRVIRNIRKNVWIDYEWQKKRLSQCPQSTKLKRVEWLNS